MSQQVVSLAYHKQKRRDEETGQLVIYLICTKTEVIKQRKTGELQPCWPY